MQEAFPTPGSTPPILGVVVVAYGSADVIVECLESLLASEDVALKVVVVDNASPDGVVQTIRDWASGAAPYRRPPNSPLRP
ncbi:MAG: glycosyltransferase family 2 protein, partial [Caulobacteraceae bacterium]|nr:glycosyltransferase family 2 protein [Caulobacteraceae bacterium]